MEYLSVVKYFYGAGGFLLIGVAVMVAAFVLHIREFNMNVAVYEFVAMLYAGAAIGLALGFIMLPTLCFIKPILLCYRIM